MNKQVTVANVTRSGDGLGSFVSLDSRFGPGAEAAAATYAAKGSEFLAMVAWADVSSREDASVLEATGTLSGLRVKMTALAVDTLQPGLIAEKEALADTVMIRDAITRHAGGKPETFKLHVQIGQAIIEREYTLILTPTLKPEEIPVEGEKAPA